MDEAPYPPHTPQPEPQEPALPPPYTQEAEALEYKPEVKIAAGVLLLLAWVGLCFVFYRLGRQSGYEEGLGSDLVAKRVNDEAIRNVAYFLQMASADDQTLLATVLRHKESLAWVKDPEVKREALSLLISELMERGFSTQVQGVLEDALPADGAVPAAWLERMLKAARRLVQSGKWEQAGPWYKRAEQACLSQNDMPRWQNILREQAALLSIGCGGSAEQRTAALQELLNQQQEHAPDATPLHAELLVLQGRTLREQGEKAASETSFHGALDLPLAEEELPMATLACLGAARLELGEREAAEKSLHAALARNDEPSPLFRIMAMRDLATLVLSESQVRETLHLIASAKALAEDCVPQESSFWPALAEQQAWALFVAHEYNEALSIFRSVLQSVKDGDQKLRVRPLEGIARCSLALGHVEEALPAAEECAILRERLFPEAKESLGRALLLLGQACDQAAHETRAAEAYGRAAQTLPEGHEGRVHALVSQAYSLTQAQQWEAAAAAWENVLPLLPEEDAAFRERAAAQLAACRKKAETAANPHPRPRPTPARSRKTPARRR